MITCSSLSLSRFVRACLWALALLLPTTLSAALTGLATPAEPCQRALPAAPAPAAFVAPAGQRHGSENVERMALIYRALEVRPGAVIADVGAGDGGYTSKLAKEVGPTGRVLAVDISPRALERLRARIERENLTNVEAIEGAVDNPRLPPGQVDAILIVNAYHEMTDYPAMLARMREALKPDGRLVILEPIAPARRGLSREEQTRRHEIAPELVQEDVRAAGFQIVALQDPLPAAHDHQDHVEWMLTMKR